MDNNADSAEGKIGTGAGTEAGAGAGAEAGSGAGAGARAVTIATPVPIRENLYSRLVNRIYHVLFIRFIMAPTQGGHVMISYQWDSQQEVLRIKTSLEESGYNVWMDLDEMQGNIFEKMAEGVENASLMIIAMTSKYESSINCNRELQYSQVGVSLI